MRSFLFVPGDNPRKFAKARAGEADALILDLEDSVTENAKDRARQTTRAMLEEECTRQKLFVRVNSFDTGQILKDLAAVIPLRPDGIVLPKCTGVHDVSRLSDYLDAFETAAELPTPSTMIIAIATETPESIFGLSSYSTIPERLFGLMWGAEDLAAAIGATTNMVEGAHTEPFRMARNLCLLAAARAGIAAIDAICPAIDDLALVEAQARAARRDGFSAKAVIHPSHVGVVNTAFTPNAEEIAWAKKVIAAFSASPQAGALRVDGKMVDKPHEQMARRLLAFAGEG